MNRISKYTEIQFATSKENINFVENPVCYFAIFIIRKKKRKKFADALVGFLPSVCQRLLRELKV